MKLIIKKVTPRPFEGSSGEQIKYYWYKALRGHDAVTIEFGSRNEYEVDDELDLDLEKTEISGGRFRYKEISS